MQFEQMTVEQLKEVLDLNGVTYRANASRDSLLELIASNGIQQFEDDAVETVEPTESVKPSEENTPASDSQDKPVEPEQVEPSKEQENPQETAAVERPYFAPAVLGADTYPMQIRIVNSTLRERVFTRITPENHSGIIPPLDSEGKVYTIANQSEAEMLELNIQEYAELEKWEDGAGIFIKGV
ncbi:MAG: hypothetical protein D8H97_01855 [Neisseria sp.]|nr:MAG: hypothetical protein D8H97_01855 [Neisseria sp.]